MVLCLKLIGRYFKITKGIRMVEWFCSSCLPMFITPAIILILCFYVNYKGDKKSAYVISINTFIFTWFTWFTIFTWFTVFTRFTWSGLLLFIQGIHPLCPLALHSLFFMSTFMFPLYSLLSTLHVSFFPPLSLGV